MKLSSRERESGFGSSMFTNNRLSSSIFQFSPIRFDGRDSREIFAVNECADEGLGVLDIIQRKPDTLCPAKDGTLMPDNAVIHAGINTGGQHFTATANLDDDPSFTCH